MLAEGDITFEGRLRLSRARHGVRAARSPYPGRAEGRRGGLLGAGKSTLIHLIQRLDDVQHGRILLDGQDIRSVSQDSLREKIAVVPQETALFNRSIRENIRYGRPDASDEEVVQAARRAFCDSFIRELPQGYDTLVGERGVMLSGGQRQRLGIARPSSRCADSHPRRGHFGARYPVRGRDPGRTGQPGAQPDGGGRGTSPVNAVELRPHHRAARRSHRRGRPATELRRRGGEFDGLWRMQAEGFNRDTASGP